MSPGILCSKEFLPCTTSSCEKGRTKFSVNAYNKENVSLFCSYLRCTGSAEKYFSVSFIQPMFHFRLKPRPPRYVGRETAGQAVDSSAMVRMAGKFSRPPNSFGTHSPSLRE